MWLTAAFQKSARLWALSYRPKTLYNYSLSEVVWPPVHQIWHDPECGVTLSSTADASGGECARNASMRQAALTASLHIVYTAQAQVCK